jgi:hypothetical protein
MNTLEKLMNKLMSSLLAATVVGAFSMSAFAATEGKPSPAAAPASDAAVTAEKPAAAPHKKHKHVAKADTKKAAAPAKSSDKAAEKPAEATSK